MSKNTALVCPLADALEIDLRVLDSKELVGVKTTSLELFEGYSPKVVSTVLESLLDNYAKVAGVYMQVWGNLNIVLIHQEASSLLELFILDRSKLKKNSGPFHMNQWSQDLCHAFMKPGLKAKYFRQTYEVEWQEACKSGG